MIFATDEEIERNVRFQMLQLRKNKVPEFKNYRMIPASENEIPRGILEAREKRYTMILNYLISMILKKISLVEKNNKNAVKLIKRQRQNNERI